MKQTVYADLDTMVFEGREKNYGAFEMRSKYNRVLSRSLMIAFLLFLSITGLPKVIQWINPVGEEIITEKVIVFENPGPLPEVKPREDPVEPPITPKVKTQPPPKRAVIEFRVIEPAPADQADEDESIRDMDELLEVDTAAIGFADVDGAATDGMGDIDWDGLIGDGTGDDVPVELTKEEDPKHTDFFVGEEPRPVNMDDVRDLIGYPDLAVEAEIEGKVVVRVLVNKTGQYKRHVVLKDPHPILTKAVEKKLNALQFTPGIQNNEPVKVWVTIPFQFTLNR